MKKLLIVESPAKIKTISKFLGGEFKIMSTIGHIKDLPTKELGITINGSIDLHYVVLENKQKVINDICREAKTADSVFLAPDPDREGEIIAWHIGQEIKQVIKDPSKIHRITFNEITKQAILEAVDHPAKIDEKKVAAQQARRVLDRWVGYEVSPILWRKIAKGLSAGRVQSVALKLICEREQEIKEFKTEEYWSITGTFEHTNGPIIAPLISISKKKIELADQASTQEVVTQIQKNEFKLTSIQDKKRLKNAAPPFMTSTLQQAAYNSLGFPVKKTMQTAQKLYEGIPLEDPQQPVALITYMRTDSLRISDTALKQTRTYIQDEFGANYLPPKTIMYAKANKAQDAHEAIRPIDIAITPESVKRYLPADAAKLYELIWKRFVACQMKPAEFAQRQVTIEGGKFLFRATGSTLIFDGFLKVYTEPQEEEEESTKIPQGIKEKDPVITKKIDPKQHFTQPPPRFTEASLVKELEKEGIGRPSTYATILNTIQARDYTKLEKKKFVPSELGIAVTTMLKENLPAIMDTKFTAMMEEDLDKIAQGSIERDDVLRAFHTAFQKNLETFMGQAKKSAEPTDIDCPNCGKHKLVIRFGKSGPFVGCPGFPECTFTSNFTRTQEGKIELTKAAEPILLTELCPNCHSPLRQMNGKFGSFIACSAYPKCRYIQQTKASFKCPLDGAGDLIKRMWRGSAFWGCSNYPKCRFTISGDIEETPCPLCKSPYLLKKVDKEGIIELKCPNKECSYIK